MFVNCSTFVTKEKENEKKVEKFNENISEISDVIFVNVLFSDVMVLLLVLLYVFIVFNATGTNR
jgi:ABC-type Fe3+-citrate transport system substrate-binding protein